MDAAKVWSPLMQKDASVKQDKVYQAESTANKHWW